MFTQKLKNNVENKPKQANTWKSEHKHCHINILNIRFRFRSLHPFTAIKLYHQQFSYWNTPLLSLTCHTSGQYHL